LRTIRQSVRKRTLLQVRKRTLLHAPA